MTDESSYSVRKIPERNDWWMSEIMMADGRQWTHREFTLHDRWGYHNFWINIFLCCWPKRIQWWRNCTYTLGKCNAKQMKRNKYKVIERKLTNRTKGFFWWMNSNDVMETSNWWAKWRLVDLTHKHTPRLTMFQCFNCNFKWIIWSSSTGN